MPSRSTKKLCDACATAGESSRVSPKRHVDMPSVNVAHSGAPSHPTAGAEPGGHAVPGGVAMNLPHASWCMSSTTYRSCSAAHRTAWRTRPT